MTDAAASDLAGFAAVGAAVAAAGLADPGAAAPPEYTPETATAKIAELKTDKAFLERYLSGEREAGTQFKRLHAIASGKPADESNLHRAWQLDTLKAQAPLMPAAMWEHVEQNRSVTPQERQAAEFQKDAMIRDREFRNRLLAGGREENSQWVQVAIILASPVAEAKK
jgi:hypothetical protein